MSQTNGKQGTSTTFTLSAKEGQGDEDITYTFTARDKTTGELLEERRASFGAKQTKLEIVTSSKSSEVIFTDSNGEALAFTILNTNDVCKP